MKLNLYCFFHLNLAYSSIEEEQRVQVIKRCYWPLLNLVRRLRVPIGIEASGYTLETVAAIDPLWVEELRRLVAEGCCEFIGSGYAQIIGPLVPAKVNSANLRLGHEVYERLLGIRPRIALVNEQAYSAGLLQHYLDAGYRAIIMEWDNPARFHPEWSSEWRYFPQWARDPLGERIAVLWNHSISFQKFQRFAHGELELDEFISYLGTHVGKGPRGFSFYGNDAEIFGFRPGRYHTEAVLREDEWQRIENLFERVMGDDRFSFICPSDFLEMMVPPGGGHSLALESAQSPIPVKKQEKYNITRWAVTGRNDLGINTVCWRIYEHLNNDLQPCEDDWRELCYLWSSDFRTHITERRLHAYLKRLEGFSEKLGLKTKGTDVPMASKRGITDRKGFPSAIRIHQDDNHVVIETSRIKLRLKCRRGLAIDGLWFKEIAAEPLCGTLAHGYYDDISMGADFYTGHVAFELPGQPKVTDLVRAVPEIAWVEEEQCLVVGAEIATSFGVILKRIAVPLSGARVRLTYLLDWATLPPGALRLGAVTLNPAAFDQSSLFFRTHNGGYHPETFQFENGHVGHGAAASFLVSAQQGIGLTDGSVELGDIRQSLIVTVNKQQSALLGLISYRPVGESYFCRLVLSAQEMDETSRRSESPILMPIRSLPCELAIEARRNDAPTE